MKASKYNHTYNIFFIRVFQDSRKARGFMIRNPIQRLGLDINAVSKLVELDNIFLKCVSYKIELKPEILNELINEEIELTQYI